MRRNECIETLSAPREAFGYADVGVGFKEWPDGLAARDAVVCASEEITGDYEVESDVLAVCVFEQFGDGFGLSDKDCGASHFCDVCCHVSEGDCGLLRGDEREHSSFRDGAYGVEGEFSCVGSEVEDALMALDFAREEDFFAYGREIGACVVYCPREPFVCLVAWLCEC